MQARINWIDWIKFFAITIVVFGHIPEERGCFTMRYVYDFHMPLFMFVSGYLTKRSPSFSDNLKKDWTGIILPYLLYNLVFYPYWAVRAYVADGLPLSIFNYVVRPLLGLLFFQVDSPISLSVSGVTWFLAALLLMRFVLDIGLRLKYKHVFWALMAVLSVGFYVFNEAYRFNTSLTITGLTKCFPFFLAGFLLHGKLQTERYSRSGILTLTILSLAGSTGLTWIQMQTDIHFQQMALFYLVAILAITGFVGLSMLFNPIRSRIVVNISIGTLIIFGLHWMVIGCVNMVFQKLLGITEIIYTPWQAMLLALAIEALLYPLIKIAPPMWLGKRKEVASQIK